MSRVFVSCAYQDREVGAELGSIVRSLGHEPADDYDEARGTGWWNEVVGRIQASDVFVAVATPAYANAHTCRLAAKHAAATGMPVVRVDLDDKAIPDCHPVVADAIGVPFAPRDPAAVLRLAQALAGSPSEVANGIAGPAAISWSPEQHRQLPSEPHEPDDTGHRVSTLEVGVTVLLVLIAASLLYLGLSRHGRSEPSAVVAPTATPSAEPTPTGGSTPDADSSATDATASALLAGVKAADSPRLSASSCRAGAAAVTCLNPAPNIGTVVLTPYRTPAELYAAYTAQVESLSGAPINENTGNCSNTSSDGEVGWNLDKAHTLGFSIAEQEAGGLDPGSESAGRVFCTAAQKVMNLVWTQDPGVLVTATGQPSELVITWWSDVHLQLAGALAAE